MKVYFNKLPGAANSIGVVAGNLASYFKKVGIEVVNNKNDAWDVALCFMYEKDLTIFQKGPVVQRLDGIYLDTDIKYEVSNVALRNTYAKAAGVIYQSEFSRNVVIKNFGQPKGLSTVILNGTEVDKTSDSYAALSKASPKWKRRLDDFPVRLICAAQWRASKRLKSIVLGSVEYMKKHPDTALFVLGDVEEKDKKNLSTRGGNVFFMGRVSNRDVKHFYRISNVCLNLSIMDACPNSVVEAMAHGIPCLVTRHQGVVELLQDNTGYVIDEGEWDYGPLSFKQAGKTIDPVRVADGIEKCVLMGRQSYRDDMSLDVMAQRYIDFLAKVANK